LTCRSTVEAIKKFRLDAAFGEVLHGEKVVEMVGVQKAGESDENAPRAVR
jgi:hypothetical protein